MGVHIGVVPGELWNPWSIVQSFEKVGNIVWHREVNSEFVIVPSYMEATEVGASPIN